MSLYDDKFVFELSSDVFWQNAEFVNRKSPDATRDRREPVFIIRVSSVICANLRKTIELVFCFLRYVMGIQSYRYVDIKPSDVH